MGTWVAAYSLNTMSGALSKRGESHAFRKRAEGAAGRFLLEA
jgi:ribosomal protein L34